VIIVYGSNFGLNSKLLCGHS